MIVNLQIEGDEVLNLISLLGSLPTSAGAYPLWTKLQQQYESEMQKATESTANPEEIKDV